MHHKRIWRLMSAFLMAGTFLFLVMLFLSATLLGSPPHLAYAQGTVITVTTSLDSWNGINNSICEAPCSLRDAIIAANYTAGSEPVTITFDADHAINLNFQSGDLYAQLRSINRSSGPVHIDGDRNDDGQPDVVVNGDNLTQTGSVGLWIKSDGVRVDGLVIRNLNCPGCWGLDIHGDDGTLVNTHLFSNTTGILLTNDADHNTITSCIVADNSDDGILISAKYATTPSEVITPAHDNAVLNSYIGTNPAGDDLGNTNKGIIIQRGATTNTIQGNVIAYNGDYALHLSDGPTGFPTAPVYDNQILDNEIHHNGATSDPEAAVVNERTHGAPGAIPTLTGGYDNLFSGNTITGNTGIGIYNIGASPLITDNTVAGNTQDGIYNLTDFGQTYSPSYAGDDILSIPIIKNNTVSGNTRHGIYSLDTAPMDRYTLHQDNSIAGHQGGLDVLQVWYGAAEVLTGTTASPQPITQGISVRVLADGAGWSDNLGAYAPASGLGSGIWGETGIQYDLVSTWAGIREFEVQGGSLIDHVTHTVQVYLNGVYTGSVRFSFDGLTSTDAISGDVGVPQWVQTGPYGRYQVPEINFTYDADDDGLPDVVEGTEDSDNDGTPDYLDTDSDGDGIPDGVEGTEDSDGDGTPDYLDTDSDNDGIPDEIEAGPDPEHPVDSDGDGVPDYLDTDSDNDGIPDQTEGLTDSDGDGIPDYIESNTEDSDGDGTPNYLDADCDGDGIPDDDEYYAGGSDSPFCTNTTLDSDGDGTPNCRDNDADGDGIPNYLDGDSDGDGIPDAQEGTGDSDGDGVPNWLDPADGADTSEGGDSDGDGISDAREYIAGASDSTFCSNSAGVDTDQDSVLNCEDNDVDGDGLPNYLDTDSDADRTPDGDESYPDPNPSPFTNGDIPAWIDPLYKTYMPIQLRDYDA